jgi:hypothetical protein
MAGRERPRVMLVARRDESGLLGSYGRAMEHMGVDVRYWDLEGAIDRSVRLGVLGRRLNSSIPIPAWQARANRAFVVAARTEDPDAIFIACTARVEAGALAQVKASVEGVRLALVWPDPMQNLAPFTIAALPIYDVVATYSERSIDSFRRLGAADVRWVPFAADTFLFGTISTPMEERQPFACDVVFVGNRRPERERAILALLDAGVNVKVWGENTWVKDAIAPARARRYWQGRPAYGADFVKATVSARLALNVIDDTNYPAANMRFFENLACRAPSLVSPCPEMEGLFPDGAGVAYFRNDVELVTRAKSLLADELERERMAEDGYRRVLAGHTYTDRASDILTALGFSLPLLPAQTS